MADLEMKTGFGAAAISWYVAILIYHFFGFWAAMAGLPVIVFIIIGCLVFG